MPIAKRMSQKDKVLKYLKEGNSITPAKAQAMFGVWRLADVIYKLKKDGHVILTQLRQDPEGKSYARYVLQ